MMKLKDKVAVIYGNGAVGGAIAKAFAREGAKVFLTGLTLAKLNTIANDITRDGGLIDIAQLDALNEPAVEKHLVDVIKNAGKVDISFNAIGIASKDAQHALLTELSVESFSLPIVMYTQSHFITAKAAARRMVKQGNGVIVMHTANISRVSAPFGGGRPPAWAAMEALCRSLSVECGAHGVRAVCLCTTAIPETPVIEKAFKDLYDANVKDSGMGWEQFYAMLVSGTHRKQLTTLKELTDAAVFVASDDGSAITGSIFNLTAGMIV